MIRYPYPPDQILPSIKEIGVVERDKTQFAAIGRQLPCEPLEDKI